MRTDPGFIAPFGLRAPAAMLVAVGGGLGLGLTIAGLGVTLPAAWHLLNGITPPLIATLGLAVCWQLPRPWRTILSAWWVLAWFALALTERWAGGASDGCIIGGFLPKSDAQAYFTEANRLLEHGRLGQWGSRRPLASAFLAAIYWLSGRDLQRALTLIVLATALATWLAAGAVRRRCDAVSTAGFVAVIFLFYRRFLGSTMSESGGLIFGLLGMALLLHGCGARQRRWLALGVFTLAIGLVIRAGPFFILPAVVLLGAWWWRQSRQAVSTGLLLAAAGFAGLGADSIAMRTVGSPGALPFSNYAYVTYGLIFGGNWATVLHDRPEIAALPAEAQPRAIYRLVGAAVRKDPSLVWKGMLRAWRAFFFSSVQGSGPFAFVIHGEMERLLNNLALIGALICLIGVRRCPLDALTLALTAGVLASLPFAPSWDADLMRAYAVTVPALALLATRPMRVLSAILTAASRFRRQTRPAAPPVPLEPDENLPATVITTGAFLAVALLPTLGVARLARCSPLVQIAPTAGVDHAVLALPPGNTLEVIDDDAPRARARRVVRRHDLIGNFGFYAILYSDETDFLQRAAKPGVTLAPGGGSYVTLFILATRSGAPGRQPVEIHGRLVRLRYAIFFVEDRVDPDPPIRQP